MKKLFLLIGLIFCLSGYSQTKTWDVVFNINDIVSADTLAFNMADNVDWFGNFVTIRVRVKNTEADDAQLFLGGTDKRTFNKLGVVDFGYLESSTHTINPLIIDTSGTVLLINPVDSIWYERVFEEEYFNWNTPAFYLIKNDTDSADMYIQFQMEKRR